MTRNNDKALALRDKLQSDSMTTALQAAIPMTARKYLTPERVVRIVTAAAARNPKLLECKPQSVLSSVIELAQLGLEPGGPLGQAYLVPYGQQCTPIVGYQGYLALARRSGEIQSVFAQVIYSADVYEIRYGDNPGIDHSPSLSGKRGDAVAVYCIAKFKDGGQHIEVMTVDEVEAVRNRSKASRGGPWVTDWAQMARKTVIRRARHYWPISVEMANAAELEANVDTGSWAPSGDIIEGEIVTNGNGKEKPKTQKLLDRVKAKPEEQEPEPAADDVAPDEPPPPNEWDHVGPPPMDDDQEMAG